MFIINAMAMLFCGGLAWGMAASGTISWDTFVIVLVGSFLWLIHKIN